MIILVTAFKSAFITVYLGDWSYVICTAPCWNALHRAELHWTVQICPAQWRQCWSALHATTKHFQTQAAFLPCRLPFDRPLESNGLSKGSRHGKNWTGLIRNIKCTLSQHLTIYKSSFISDLSVQQGSHQLKKNSSTGKYWSLFVLIYRLNCHCFSLGPAPRPGPVMVLMRLCAYLSVCPPTRNSKVHP